MGRGIPDRELTAVALAWLHDLAPSAEDATVLAFSDRFSEGSIVTRFQRAATTCGSGP